MKLSILKDFKTILRAEWKGSEKNQQQIELITRYPATAQEFKQLYPQLFAEAYSDAPPVMSQGQGFQPQPQLKIEESKKRNLKIANSIK